MRIDVASPDRDHAESASRFVSLSALPLGHAWRVRGIDESHVMTLSTLHGSLPPIVVSRADMTIIDGAHRVASARRLGLHVIAAEFFDGDRLEAFGEFVRRNAHGGLEVAAEDRRDGVLRALASAPEWSDRRVAQLCGVSPKMVARLRRGRSSPQAGAEIERRVGRDGRARPVRPTHERAKIAELIRRKPSASLRAIATELGVSPETVRSVRREQAVDRGPRSPSRVDRGGDDRTTQRLEPRVAEDAAAWREDKALSATPEGVSFVEWFESTAVTVAPCRVDDVPLSRVYEIADEARRRARFWIDLADSLESRTRRRR
jgi:hypothetical protein